MPKIAVTKAEYEMLASFRHTIRQFLRFSEEAAMAAGIRPQQHQALLAIKGFPGRDTVTITELAEHLQIRHHSAVELASRLVAKGWARKVRSREDRRRVSLSVTPRGEKILSKLTADHKRQLASLEPEMRRLLDRLSVK